MTDKPPKPPLPKPSLHLNWEDWLPHFADWDASDEQKCALITTVWTIMKCFADYGWQIEPNAETSGQSFDLTAALEAAVLYSEGKQAPARSKAVATKDEEEI
ncbi:MAG: hypothetical protein AAF943_08790 [Pseudomonadota bacterium]